MDRKAELKKIITSIQTLPTLPTVAVKINQLTRSLNAGAIEIAKIIELDPSIAVKVLSLINSAFYGLSRKIGSIKEAVAYLGTNAISQLVLSLGVISTFKDKKGEKFDRKGFWEHSIAVALISREMAQLDNKHKHPDDVFTSGLLHDLGKVAMDYCCQESFCRVFDELSINKQPFYSAEEKVLGINHSRVGEWVARNWEIPLLIIVAIRYHHDPTEARKDFNLSYDSVVDIVTVADWLAIINSLGYSGSNVVEEPDEKIFKRIPITKNECLGIVKKIRPEVSEAVELLGIK